MHSIRKQREWERGREGGWKESWQNKSTFAGTEYEMPHKYLVCISSNLSLAHLGRQTDAQWDRQTDIFPYFTAGCEKQKKKKKEKQKQAQLLPQLVVTFLCYFAVSLSFYLILSSSHSDALLAIFPALTNLIRHFVEAANHPSEQIHQNNPAQPPWTTLAPPPSPSPTPALTAILWFLLLAFYYICLCLCLGCLRCFLHKNVEIPEDILLCNFLTSR